MQSLRLLGMLLVAGGAMAASVPGWRGDGSGEFAAPGAVTTWSPELNVVWKTPMEQWSNASPMVLDGRIFVCSEIADLVCVDLASGRVLWQKANGLADIASSPEEAQTIRERQLKGVELKKEIDPLSKKARSLEKKGEKATGAQKEQLKEF